MGNPPEKAGLLIFMGVDVQKDRLEGTAVAFAPGFEMHIVDSQVWNMRKRIQPNTGIFCSYLLRKKG